MKEFDVLIIGSGPAGLTAAVYAARSGLTVGFIDKDAPGGKVVNTSKIENWPGDKYVTGPDLALRMFEHATSYETEFIFGEVTKIENINKEEKYVVLADGAKIKCRALIIATGMKERIPEDIVNIDKFTNKGVYYCAICDGWAYKGKEVAVIGGGSSAIEEATYLASLAKKVHVFVRNKTRASVKLMEEANSKENLIIHLKSKMTSINGKTEIESISANINGAKKDFNIKGVFPYIGFVPTVSFAKELGFVDENGFITVDENMETKVEGIYAIGDILNKNVKQITTAVNDGAIVGKILGNRL